jgi:hypothetical protein
MNFFKKIKKEVMEFWKFTKSLSTEQRAAIYGSLLDIFKEVIITGHDLIDEGFALSMDLKLAILSYGLFQIFKGVKTIWIIYKKNDKS